MAVNQGNYSYRGSNNLGIVLCCPHIVGDHRLLYFDHDRRTGAWVLRDFLSGLRLESRDSHLTVAMIEADATHDEFPPWHNAANAADWRLYLSLRTTAALGVKAVSTAPPNPASGNWRPL